MTLALRVLGLDGSRWRHVGPASFFNAVVYAVGASVVLALNRFGGLVVDTPRAFTRTTLVGVYGWLGLSLGIWLIATQGRALRAGTSSMTEHRTPLLTTISVGLAHLPILILDVVIFVAAGLFRVFGPGYIAAVFVFGFWFPALLVASTRYMYQLRLRHAAGIVVIPYLIWLATAGRHLLGQVQHLL